MVVLIFKMKTRGAVICAVKCECGTCCTLSDSILYVPSSDDWFFLSPSCLPAPWILTWISGLSYAARSYTKTLPPFLLCKGGWLKRHMWCICWFEKFARPMVRRMLIWKIRKSYGVSGMLTRQIFARPKVVKGMHKGTESLLRTRMNADMMMLMVLPRQAACKHRVLRHVNQGKGPSGGWNARKPEEHLQEYLRIDSETPTLMPQKHWKNSNHCYLTGSRIFRIFWDRVSIWRWRTFSIIIEIEAIH